MISATSSLLCRNEAVGARALGPRPKRCDDATLWSAVVPGPNRREKFSRLRPGPKCGLSAELLARSAANCIRPPSNSSQRTCCVWVQSTRPGGHLVSVLSTRPGGHTSSQSSPPVPADIPHPSTTATHAAAKSHPATWAEPTLRPAGNSRQRLSEDLNGTYRQPDETDSLSACEASYSWAIDKLSCATLPIRGR